MGIGALVGDFCGSCFEWQNVKTKDFPIPQYGSHITDDSLMTLAVAHWLRNGRIVGYNPEDLVYHMRWFGNNVTLRRGGFGHSFAEWLVCENPQPYNSWGNGSAMRVSPIAWHFDTIEDVLFYSKMSAEVTHNHPEGIKGAQAIASCIFLAHNGKTKTEIKEFIETQFGYDLNFTLVEIRPTYKFDVSCQGSCPQAIVAFLESTDFEDAIRNAISIGGDSDTIACMTGGIAEAFYGRDTIPQEIMKHVINDLYQTPCPILYVENLGDLTKMFLETYY